MVKLCVFTMIVCVCVRTLCIYGAKAIWAYAAINGDGGVGCSGCFMHTNTVHISVQRSFLFLCSSYGQRRKNRPTERPTDRQTEKCCVSHKCCFTHHIHIHMITHSNNFIDIMLMAYSYLSFAILISSDVLPINIHTHFSTLFLPSIAFAKHFLYLSIAFRKASWSRSIGNLHWIRESFVV